MFARMGGFIVLARSGLAEGDSGGSSASKIVSGTSTLGEGEPPADAETLKHGIDDSGEEKRPELPEMRLGCTSRRAAWVGTQIVFGKKGIDKKGKS